jgi:uncharacterized protein with ParB-like and HNH nuclease domain
MAELIYNVRNLFSLETSETCLMEYDVDKYHIAAYQRGYKWGTGENGAVTILLQDLLNSFKSQSIKKKEYYLQYITLKKDSDKRHFEVIDGQQRLTTLSILISVLSGHLNIENLASDKLEYAIRENFFQNFIYNEDALKSLIKIDWNEKLGLVFEEGENINNQDVYYLFHAVKAIDFFSEQLNKDNLLKEFFDFCLDQVKVIVNVVDNISSEKIFSNLNSNKVPLTESELIKGLLLTRVARNQKEDKYPSFREICELRFSIGVKWDYLEKWCNRPEINSFYFESNSGIENLLLLTAQKHGYKKSGKENTKELPLFNFFHNHSEIELLFESLFKIHNKLNDWFVDDKIYNLIGFLFFAKSSDKKTESIISTEEKSKSDFEKRLITDVLDMIPKNPEKLLYGNNEDIEIHRTLLALNVFIDGNTIRFNFDRFIREKWTLEHIFPQTPEGKGNVLLEKDKLLIKNIIGKVSVDVEKILDLPERTKEQREVYQIELEGNEKLNSIGNMCLLTDKDNISNGCGFFYEKRSNILNRIRKGSFVPKHTFDVFSKMIFEENPGDHERWDLDNINSHKEIIANRISSLNI